MICSDFHAHTSCDHGAATPTQMIRAAAAAGMPAVGLVGHARITPFPCTYAMSEADETAFRAEMAALRTEYAGKMDVFCGIELDYYSPPPEVDYDYRIGSVHYVMHDGAVISVDSDPDQLREDVRTYYGGDFRKLFRAYFENVANILKQTNADLIGHFDLVSKFNEGGVMFDPDDPAYRSAATDAIDTLIRADRLFEINTGAISRGYRTAPYPADWMLRAIHQHGGRIILSSDAHATNTFCYAFDQATSLARACGFTTAWVLTEKGFVEQPL